MKQLLFVDHTPFVGGAELVLAEHIRHLDRSRFVPHVACTPVVPELIELYRTVGAAVHITPLPQLRGRGPLAVLRLLHSAWHLRRLVRREKIDIVVSNTSRAAYVATVSLLGTGLPLIWWVRDFLYGDRWFRLLQRFPARIICVSRAIRDFYGGQDDARFEVIYVGNGLYNDLEGVTEESIARERARWGFGKDDIVVGFMGRLVADKGIEDVIAAAEQANLRDPRIRLIVVGTGANQEMGVEEKVRLVVEKRDLHFIRFAGFQTDEALYYSLFDIFVLATRTGEPFATSVVQAMMAGTAVVATATGGTPEIVFDRLTGLLVAPRSPQELAAALTSLAADPELRARLAAAGRDFALEHNREEQTTAQVEALYDQLDGPSPSTPLKARA